MDHSPQPLRLPTPGTPARSVRSHPLSLLVCISLLAADAVAIFLVGASQGHLGIFLGVAGLAMILCPPRCAVDWRLWAAAAGLVLCGSLAFLPAAWFGVPAWRQALGTSPAIVLPATLSLIPQETAFWLGILAFSALTGLFLFAHPIRSPGLLGIATAAVLVCALYAALAIYSKQSGWHYPFESGAPFGFFPNRNHTATLLVTGSILAMGVLAVVVREGRWVTGILAAVGLTLCVVALLFFSASRGGVVFLLTGTLLWIAGLGRAHRNVRLLISVGALLAAGGVLFLVSGSEVHNRLLGSTGQPPPSPAKLAAVEPPPELGTARNPPETSQDTPLDARLLIYLDTLRLIRAYPVTGTGLGTFTSNFAYYRSASLNAFLPIHPESDWLMPTAEAGIPALLCLLALGWLLSRRLAVLRENPYWPLRWGCVAAAAAAVLHGFVDVPAHRTALGWWILIMAGLGLQISKGQSPGRSRVQHALFVLGGLASLTLGSWLICAEWFGAHPLPPYVAAKAQQEILAAFNRHDAEGAMDLARAAVKNSPMEAPLYYQFGVLLLHFEDTDTEVDQVFKAQRLLNPTWPSIPLQQGDAWSTVDPNRTATLWLDALERQQRINRATGASADDGVGFYRDLLSRAKSLPGVQRALGSVAIRSPAYALAWLDGVSPETASGQLDQMVKNDELLKRFSLQERQRFLLGWHVKGKREALAAFLNEHHDWKEQTWQVLHLQQLTDDQRFEEAVRETADHYHVSLAVAAALGKEGSAPSQQPDGFPAEFERYWHDGNTVAARRVLAEAGYGGRKELADPEYWRLKTVVAVYDGDWGLAWKCLKMHIAQVLPGEFLPQ